MKTIKTDSGNISGVPCGNPAYTVFKGVPYAAPPVGDKRWKAPTTPKPWNDVKNCDTFPNIAIQGTANPGDFYQKEFGYGGESMSEDCLYLNVWTPAKDGNEKLPVMVWIHGGAYLQGYGHELEFDGEGFCKRGVILVTINYRLGAFGYLAHPELNDEHGVSGNYGLQDQIFALKWVKKNIAVFGGDPGNVTVFGQSAGGGSVISLCASPLTRGLVHKAIIQSAGGVGTLGGEYKLEDAEKFGKFICEHNNLTIDKLRSMPADEVFGLCMSAMMAFGKGEFKLHFLPCVDGVVLDRDPGAVIASDGHWPIPYMTGAVSGDKMLFGDTSIDWSLLKNADNPLYVYYFDREMPGGGGAFHSSELWYIFGTLQRCWRPMNGEDYDLSQRMADYWANFAKNGDPNGGDAPKWEPYTKETPFILNIGGTPNG